MGDLPRRNALIGPDNSPATAVRAEKNIAAMTLLQTGSCQIFLSTEVFASLEIIFLGE
jgi:hypothetical protein